MENLPVGIVDLIVIGVIAISALLAYFRGFLRELLSILAWGGAAIATWYGYPYAEPYAADFGLQEPLGTTIAAVVGVFLVSLIALSVVTSILSGMIRESGPGSVDKALGFAFGLARGALIVAVLYLGSTMVLKEEALPLQVTESRSFPAVKLVAARILSWLPDEIRAKAHASEREAQETAEEVRQAQEIYEKLSNPQPSGSSERGQEQQGYDNKQRQQLDSLLKQAE